MQEGGGEPVVMEEVVLEVKGEDGGGFWFGGLTGSTPWVDWAYLVTGLGFNLWTGSGFSFVLDFRFGLWK